MKFIFSYVKWSVVVSLGIISSFSLDQAAFAERLKVATKPFKPFVFVESETKQPTGYSIDLWHKISQKLGKDYEFIVFESVSDVIDAVKTGKADVAISGITVNAEREEVVDFSHPYYKSGLRILIFYQSQYPIIATLNFLFSWETLQAVSILLGVALAAAHLLWIFERHHNSEMFPKTYLAGIWESLWWSLVTATTVGYGDKSPVSFVGRLVAIIWMFTGLFVVAYFTAAITADRLESNISDLIDLFGKQVATVADTTSARYMNQQPVKLIEFDQVEDAYKALKAGQVQALVYDSPTLLYQTSQNREYQIVGELFAEQDYGIVLPQGSHYRESINRIILQLQEDGELTNLEQKWFPSNQ